MSVIKEEELRPAQDERRMPEIKGKSSDKRLGPKKNKTKKKRGGRHEFVAGSTRDELMSPSEVVRTLGGEERVEGEWREKGKGDRETKEKGRWKTPSRATCKPPSCPA